MGDCFLSFCNSLTTLKLPSAWQVSSITGYFLKGCYNLSSLTLPYNENLTKIGTDFLYDCRKLTSLDFSKFINITSIAATFLYNCYELTSVNMGSINATIMSQSNYTFSSNTQLVKCYRTGITILGNDRQAIKIRFANRNGSPYRHVV